MIRIQLILTGEDQSKPILRREFRSKIKDYGIEFVDENSDMLLVHATLVTDKILNYRKPIVILERIDAAIIRNRQHISLPSVVGVIKNSIYRNPKLNNEETFQGRYHCRVFHDAVKNQEPLEKVKYPIDNKYFEKLEIGYGFGIYDSLKFFKDTEVNFDSNRDIDIQFAGTVSYGRVNSISNHRQLSVECMKKLKNVKTSIVSGRSLRKEPYKNLVMNSKILLSPWGLGEPCYRDFESMYCGCVMIKPDTSFVQTWPDIFVNDKHYIPCKCDFSDLQEKVDYIKGNWSKFKQMRIDNRNLLLSTWNNDLFCKRMSDIFKRCYQRKI